MKNATKFLALVSFIYMCIINDQIQSLNVPDHENFAESPLSLDDISSSLEQYEALMSNEHPRRINPLFGHRRSDSAEKYFDWASKTQRPMEYFRGKRYWLFTKKNEHGPSFEQVPSLHSASNSLSQGIWRSGIVGRRRR